MIFRLRKTTKRDLTLLKFARGMSLRTEDYVRGLVPVTDFRKEHADLFRNGIVDIQQPSSPGLLAKLDRNHPLSAFGKIRQGIAENPASINKKTNKRYGNRWAVGEGVFTLTPKELRSLRLPSGEKAFIHPYHDLRDVGRYFRAESPSLNIIYSTPDTCPDINLFPTLKEHFKRFRIIMRARRETKSGRNRWWQ